MEKQKILVRPVRESDLRSLCDMASKIGAGLSTLPNDEAILSQKIQQSLQSFKPDHEQKAGLFLFVLEDLESRQIRATSAIEAQAGHRSPFYSYALETLEQHYHSEDGLLNRVQTSSVLYLNTHYQEASLLCTLSVDPKYRALGYGSLMSRIRYLFIAEFPNFFADTVIADMRGVFNEQNQFPFWQGLGQYFYQMDLLEVEKCLAREGSQIISELNPKLPIYVNLLPSTAQAVMGQVHSNTQAALHVLKKEGFVYRNQMNVLDGGPIVEAQKKQMRSFKTSQKARVAGFKSLETQDPTLQPWYIVSNAKLEFKASLAKLEWHSEEAVYLEPDLAEILEVQLGDTLRFNLLR